MSNLGAIRKLRDDLKLTQSQLADLIGVHALTVSKWARGKLHPTHYQAALLADFRRAASKAPGCGLAAHRIMRQRGVGAALWWIFSHNYNDITVGD